ncbi:MAG: cysteine synthase A [Synergistales bacterium]|jgi:cysteine synthase A
MRSRVDELAAMPLVGQTPVVRLAARGGSEVWIKMEGNNPGGSIKDRAAWGMLRKAERDGILKEGAVIVEPTSGNTGIALAMLGRAMGVRVILTMPESMSAERRAVLSAYGAQLALTPAAEGMGGAVKRAEDLVRETPGAFMPNQFDNPGNPWAHQVTTGPEILIALKGRAPSAFVAGVGTGGTLTGVGRSLKAAFPEVRVVAAEPAKSPVLGGGKPSLHGIQGIGANFVPKNLDRAILDEIRAVEDEAAFEMTRWLAREKGLFCGISTGANVSAAFAVADEMASPGIVVTVSPDRGDKYLSTGVFASA